LIAARGAHAGRRFVEFFTEHPQPERLQAYGSA
jgi:hypothetical protein